MALVGPDGVPTDRTISFDKDTSPLDATADGAGYLLVSGSGGVYDARPDGMHRVTTGQVLAAGPAGWLVAECDVNHHCANVLRDRAGRSRTVPGTANLTRSPTGVISPDGATATVFTTTPDNVPALTLIDLATGHSRRIDMPEAIQTDESSLAWSPDSRWLFVVDAAGHLRVVDPTTADWLNPGWAPFVVRQIAIRATPTEQ
jgi:hypothetical protein